MILKYANVFMVVVYTQKPWDWKLNGAFPRDEILCDVNFKLDVDA